MTMNSYDQLSVFVAIEAALLVIILDLLMKCYTVYGTPYKHSRVIPINMVTVIFLIFVAVQEYILFVN